MLSKFDIQPNYYAYELKVNGRSLSDLQKQHFFNSINKIYRNNYKFIYRGEKKEKLQLVYGLQKEKFDDTLCDVVFVLGAKANMFINSKFPLINELIAEAGSNEFCLIFQMLANLFKSDFRSAFVSKAMVTFKRAEENVISFFANPNNKSTFINIVNGLDSEQQFIVRDYYLALLHHISNSEYYTSSFLLSTSTSFEQANRFAWNKGNEKDSLIFFGWLPEQYEGILNVPDTRILKRKVDMKTLNLPFYEKSFFPFQKEITLKGGLLPHYLLGYLHNSDDCKVFEINPALFQVDGSWNGVELPVDQSSFHERMEKTLFGKFFSVENDNKFTQYHKLKKQY